MINSPDLSGQLAIDAQAVDKLRNQVRRDPQEGLKQTAKQFEALFLNMMVKSMRETIPKGGLFDSDQSRFYTQMLDQQLVQNLSEKGVGLADVLVQQLSRTIKQEASPDNAISQAESLLTSIAGEREEPLISLMPGQIKDLPSRLWSNSGQGAKPGFSTVSPAAGEERMGIASSSRNADPTVSAIDQPREFVLNVLPHARKVARETGIPEHFMIAQAALETGWGKYQIRRADSQPSFNLFGIKAGEGWHGRVAEAVTTEYVDGKPQKCREKFRAYNSYEEAFRDYARLLQNNPRYAAVLKSRSATAFAWGLQEAGYATDPSYAEKLLRIINSDALSI
ncbi:flagellar assembly peptidoglycan hydrolase FlgJ [Nitrosomonas sp.]|uniref:flagellar assembly peptidoglycan hydrolase FlgJ n=1 Tax=Nitrosomonas sp. TaxID=42353 RepID=UPI0025F3B5EB|nr:flagellar assembly peptidoglycan hydrolase FlgJ [Nitrosomonas sp.]MCC6916451.1 flagellar assembly peptidoglycan hydrolase FlgJ [Nitrosomonas sp.]